MAHKHRVTLQNFPQDKQTKDYIRKSRSYVDRLVSEGRAFWLDEFTAQMKPSREYAEDRRNFVSGGGYDSAWSIRPSGGMPCWQLNT